MTRIPIVGVMGSRDTEYPELSIPLGQLIALKGYHLLTGGGQGVMLKVSESFCQIPPESRLGRCLGIIPTEQKTLGEFNLRPGYPNRYVEIPIISPLPVYDGTDPNQISRNHINIMTSDIVIALPGGKGTANEIDLAIKFEKPILLFGPEEHFALIAPTIGRANNLGEIDRFLTENRKIFGAALKKKP